MTSSPERASLTDDHAEPGDRRSGGLAATAALLAGLAAPASATSIDQVLTSTPLVLKDGRIAEVSVHTVPFPGDAVAPASAARNDLDAFSRSIATDCFLTAQVIGHVDRSEISGRATADIHRLARARADTIQTSLIDNGLPAASIASVWDWRFMVQQPRVTLWVFRLTAGEDCEDTPLIGGSDDQIAAIASPPSPAETPERAAPQAVQQRAAALEEAPAPAEVSQQIVPAAKPKNREVAAALPRVPAAPASAVPATASPSRTEAASLQEAAEVDEKGSIVLADSGALEIVFATNSSYFPEGAGERLRAFIKTLDKDKSYVLRIHTSVDGSAGVPGASSTEEAARYNAWLAERRFKRVEAWLLKNSDGRQLTLEPTMIENDGSRLVRVVPNPLG